jgi:hypothetical protein
MGRWFWSTRRVAATALCAAAAALTAGGVAAAQTETLPSEVDAAVIAAAATELGVDASEVSVLRFEAVTWTDSCLGAGGPAESCLQVLTPGYTVWAGSSTVALRYHTDDDASSLRLVETGIDPSTVATAPLPEGGTLVGPGRFNGVPLPTTGGVVLLSTASGELGRGTLAALLDQAGCKPVTIARTVAGSWQVFVPGAPEAVNEASGFPETVAPSTAFFTRCAAAE